jgi:cob(I)alamin adenosyltransferase
VPERNSHRGDGGETQLASGQRVRKDDLRIECVGSVDELSSFLGLARAGLEAHTEVAGMATLVASLQRIQRELYVLGAELARRDGESGTGITSEHVATLDRELADIDTCLPKLRAFILPGGGQWPPRFMSRALSAVEQNARPCAWRQRRALARRSFRI